MDKSCPVPEPFSNMLWSVLFLTLLFFLTFISRFIFAPLMPEIVRSLSITQGQAGSVFLIASIGAAVGSISSGWFATRLQHKWTMVLAVLVAGSALVTLNFIVSLQAVRGAMLVLGLCAGILMPSCVATITAIVSRQDWGKALAVQQLGPPMALVTGPLLAVALGTWFVWNTTLASLGAAVILIGLLFAWFGKVGTFPGDPPNTALLKTIFSEKSFWCMVILFVLGIGGQVGIYSMLPLYLVTERGLPAETANTILGFSQVSALFMTFISGWIADRIGEKYTICIFLILAGTATLLIGCLSGLWLKVMVFLQPALIVCFFPPGFAALSRIVQPNLRSLASAFGPPIALLLGAGGLPAFLGYMGEAYSIGLGIAIVGGLIIAGSFFALPLKLLENLDDGC
ncbi:MAG: MFS transporter [Desulfobacteraceae bacterium]|nr:MFS transporter [Desulfobacteraceae bacterium]